MPADREPTVDPVVGGPRRAHYIGAPHFFNLSQACRIVCDAFEFGFGVYLVGSALNKRDYRDVDVRCIVSDADFERLFPGLGTSGAAWRHPLWSLLCSSISLYLSRASELPVDFQIQSMTEANRDYPKREHPRNYLGFFYQSTGVEDALRSASREGEEPAVVDGPTGVATGLAMPAGVASTNSPPPGDTGCKTCGGRKEIVIKTPDNGDVWNDYLPCPACRPSSGEARGVYAWSEGDTLSLRSVGPTYGFYLHQYHGPTCARQWAESFDRIITAHVAAAERAARVGALREALSLADDETGQCNAMSSCTPSDEGRKTLQAQAFGCHRVAQRIRALASASGESEGDNSKETGR